MPEFTVRERFEQALARPNPGEALYGLAHALKSEGMSQLDMYRLFDGFRARLDHDTDSPQYNAVLATMDAIVAWGSHGLFEQELDRSLYDPAFMKDGRGA